MCGRHRSAVLIPGYNDAALCAPGRLRHLHPLTLTNPQFPAASQSDAGCPDGAMRRRRRTEEGDRL